MHDKSTEGSTFECECDSIWCWKLYRDIIEWDPLKNRGNDMCTLAGVVVLSVLERGIFQASQKYVCNNGTEYGSVRYVSRLAEIPWPRQGAMSYRF